MNFKIIKKINWPNNLIYSTTRIRGKNSDWMSELAIIREDNDNLEKEKPKGNKVNEKNKKNKNNDVKSQRERP